MSKEFSSTRGAYHSEKSLTLSEKINKYHKNDKNRRKLQTIAKNRRKSQAIAKIYKDIICFSTSDTSLSSTKLQFSSKVEFIYIFPHSFGGTFLMQPLSKIRQIRLSFLIIFYVYMENYCKTQNSGYQNSSVWNDCHNKFLTNRGRTTVFGRLAPMYTYERDN